MSNWELIKGLRAQGKGNQLRIIGYWLWDSGRIMLPLQNHVLRNDVLSPYFPTPSSRIGSRPITHV